MTSDEALDNSKHCLTRAHLPIHAYGTECVKVRMFGPVSTASFNLKD